MITDKIENLRNYAKIDPAFTKIADWLDGNDMAELPTGSIEIGDGIILNLSEYEPYPTPDKWEAHLKYADLQVVVRGNERMDSAPVSNGEGGEGYHDDDDYELYKSCGDTYTSIFGTEGIFAYFAPCDAHRPGLKYKADKVKKAVFKIPV